MDAIGLNPIKLDAIGLDPVRMNAIRLGVPGASSGSARPYIDPELLSHVKMAISTWGKTNDDPDRAVLKDLSGNGNDMSLLNFGFAGDSGYGLYHTNFSDWNKPSVSDFIKYLTNNSFHVINSDSSATKRVIYQNTSSSTPDIKGFKIKVEIIKGGGYYRYFDNTGRLRFFPIQESGIYELPTSYNSAMSGEDFIGFTINTNSEYKLEQLPDFEGWLCTDGIDDLIVSVKPVSEMLEGSNEITVVSIIHQIKINDSATVTNDIRNTNIASTSRNAVKVDGKTGIYGYSRKGTDDCVLINNILGDKTDYTVTSGPTVNYNNLFSVVGTQYGDYNSQIAYAGGFIANKSLTTDEINQIIAYFNLDRPGQIIKPQLYCNVKKQGITNDNHAEFSDQLIDFVGGHNIQLNNIGWEGESGIIDGALYLDGISDFGKATGLPILKDYTICALRKWLYGDSVTSTETGSIVSKSKVGKDGAFILEQTFNRNPSRSSTFSFGTVNSLMSNDKLNEESFTYQTKYSYNGEAIVSGSGVDSDSMWLGTIRDGDARFSKLALWSLMLFPYSLSEFLLERQLRKYKAGTLYPDMIEFRPIVKSNIPYSSVSYSVNPGEYIAEGSTVTITITLSNASDKLVGVSSNAIVDISISGDNGVYEVTGKVTKSPQKIDIAIAEYIRYEDIVQPYPFVVPIYDENSNLVSWGDKLKIGSTIRYGKFISLLAGMYQADAIYFNGNNIDGTGGTLIVEKTMVFSNSKRWLLSTAEPLFAYDPSMINNIGLKNLGYLPDISGQGRHLKLNNMAYDEESGIGTDGALHYDGVDDHGIVQSLSHGGQCLIMKANWNVVEQMMFDQRLPVNTVNTFSIYLSSLDKDNNTVPAYQSRNDGGETYIDNVLNKYVGVRDLMGKTHVITATNENSDDSNTVSPKFGCSNAISMFCQFAMFRTMLLPEIPSSEDRTTINNWCGIEGNYVEKPEYYWDAHGKTNADPDRNTIKNRGTEQSLISNSSPTNLQTDWIANEFTFVNSASDVDIMSGDRLASTAYEARFLTGQVIPAMQVTLTLVNSAYDTFSYMYVDEEGTYQRIYFNDLVLNEPVTVDLPKNNNNNTNTGFILEANNPNAVINVKVLSQSVNIENAFDLEANNLAYTDESGYKENGLYLDGVEDYLVNPNVPAFTDYTYIFKREILANDTINSVTMHKGLVKEFAGGFTVDYVIDDVDNFVYHSFGRGNVVSRKSVENSIIYGTTTSVNGITINRGSNTDDNSITIGKYASNYRKMVFCKLALFSKTIDMLSINMLRNLFELDEIIDLNNKLFKK